ncbi:sensor histidine kinase [Streptomyces sp. ODS05-4]|uniref:sensor histidine kinase n=1 Tax=Streptomyces sp. ODS05-4 TaxID=2944939 RepID=UPI00210D28AD|nr:histidine kinase [Streptomyces sp. ODS05-4]
MTGMPSLPLQLNALQALCRQVFGFRLAMTVLATPFALEGAAAGLGTWLVGAAVLVTFMVSYVVLRDWERFGPVLLRHPAVLAADALCGALLLATASPESVLAYVTLCTPLLAGLLYGWRGAAFFAVLQSLLLLLAYGVNRSVAVDPSSLLFPGLCVIAGAVGSTLRGLILDVGAASQALTEARARLSAHQAVESERARLAREMHDSVAKTLYGLALAADSLAATADRDDPDTLRHQAELVARSARRAAAESRELLDDLRRETGLDGQVDLAAELSARAADFGTRHAVIAAYRPPAPPLTVPPRVPPAVARHLVAVAAEAMDNAHRHARPSYITVTAGVDTDVLRMSVYDDGAGLPPGTTLNTLRSSGHFGVVGMVERAAAIGARIRIGRGQASRGTEVRVELPVHSLTERTPHHA